MLVYFGGKGIEDRLDTGHIYKIVIGASIQILPGYHLL